MANVDGEWDCITKSPLGEQKSVFTIQSNGDSFTGQQAGQMGSLYVIDGAQRKGDSLALSPKHKVTVSANYTLPLDESIGRITLGANYIYTGKQITNYGDRNSDSAAISKRRTHRLPSPCVRRIWRNWASPACPIPAKKRSHSQPSSSPVWNKCISVDGVKPDQTHADRT